MKSGIQKDNLITIGRILTTQGNKGELRVLPLTDFPHRFTVGLEIFLKVGASYEKHRILSVRPHQKWIVLRLEQITSMDLAERLRDSLIKIPIDEVMPLPKGSYYVFQLLGLSVYTETGDFLGEVEDILQTGSNDVYQIKHPETGKEILLPGIKECIRVIDLDNQKILVHLLPGLVDDE